MTDDDAAGDGVGDPSASSAAPAVPLPAAPSTLARALAIGLVVVLALAGLCGALGYHAYRGYRNEQQRALFVSVAKQAAVNLTSIDYRQAEADVQRILDVSTDGFHDDFAGRSGPFVDVVKKAQSTSSGTVTAAGVESMAGDEAQVLVAVKVMRSDRSVPEAQPRYWRMRLTVTKVDGGAKVSRVDFP